MTMNRQQRRKLERATRGNPIARAMAEHYLSVADPCPDCTADATITVDGPIVHVNIEHDDTCPSYRAMNRGGAR